MKLIHNNIQREADMHGIIFLSFSSFAVELDLLFADWKMQKSTNKNSDELQKINYIKRTEKEKYIEQNQSTVIKPILKSSLVAWF